MPPHSEIKTIERVSQAASNRTWMVENIKQERSACMVARAIVRLCGGSTNNKTPQPQGWALMITIPKGTKIAEMEQIPYRWWHHNCCLNAGEYFRNHKQSPQHFVKNGQQGRQQTCPSWEGTAIHALIRLQWRLCTEPRWFWSNRKDSAHNWHWSFTISPSADPEDS